MSGMMEIGLSGVLASQHAIEVTSNNIANVNTPGYVRQSVDFSVRSAGVGNIGGVTVNDVQQNYNDYNEASVRNAMSQSGGADIYAQLTAGLSNFVTNPSADISQGLSSFYHTLQNLSSDPTSIVTRQAFLNQAQVVTSQFNSVSGQLTEQATMTNQQITALTGQVNAIANSLAQLNVQLSKQAPPDPQMLNNRNQLLEQLSTLVNANITANPDGSVNVYLGGGGGPLVVAGNASTLDTVPSDSNPQNVNLRLQSIVGKVDNVNASITGGELSGLLKFRDQVIAPAQLALGQLALGFSASMNGQHSLGMDLQGNLGQPLFTDINSGTWQAARVAASVKNTGNAVATAQVDDVNLLKNSQYQFQMGANNQYTFTRLSDHAVVASGTLGSAPQSISADGFTLNVQFGSMNQDDTFYVTPQNSAAQNIAVNIQDPAKLAIASPIKGARSISNTGSGQLSAGELVNNGNLPSNASSLPTLQVKFLSSTQYQIVNASTAQVLEGPIQYDPNQKQNIFPTPGGYDPGYRFTISGAPQAEDQFNMMNNVGGTQDNRNALALVNLKNTPVLSGGTQSVNNAADLFAGVLTATANFADVNQKTSTALLAQAQNQRDSISGVNTEEEAAKLLQYQQAFQANAKVIAVASQLFATLLALGQ